MQNHDKNAEFNEYIRENNEQKDIINTSNPIKEEKINFSKEIEENIEAKKSEGNTSIKQFTIQKQEEPTDKEKNTPIYIVAILVLSMLCGVLGAMYFQQKEENKELNSKIDEQSQIIYDYKFGTLP